ncbi:MAG: hypothetical protein R2698_13510 [Microthrixaceae bacterium]
MLKMVDSLSTRFPQRSPWAIEALRVLSSELSPSADVLTVNAGHWTSSTRIDATRLDALYLLTDDRIGVARAGDTTGSWTPLADVRYVDDLVGPILPMQLIEVTLVDGSTFSAIWPEPFTACLVARLTELAAPVEHYGDLALSTVAITDTVEDRDRGPFTLDLVETGRVEAVDLSDRSVVELHGANATLRTDAGGHAVGFADDRSSDPSPTGRRSSARPAILDDRPRWATPDPVLDRAMDAWFAVDTPSPVAPAKLAAEFEGTHEAPRVDVDASPPSTARNENPPDLPSEQTRWSEWASENAESSDREWPGPFEGVNFLGSYPTHSRRRKNGTLEFSLSGFSATGGSFQSWSVEGDWASVERLVVQGRDEVLFSEQLKIDSGSSALVFDLTEGRRLYFEIKGRRPPSVRASLEPVLEMLDSLNEARVAVR